MQIKKYQLVIPLVTICVILFIGLLNLLGISVYPISREYCGCHHMIPTYFFLVFGILLILAAIPVSYYFISKKMGERLDKHMEIMSKILNKGSKQGDTNPVDKQSILKFLNASERRILERMLESEGSVLQSEIGRMDNMTKLKAHRAVKNLEQKGILKTEPYGKTNKIFLTNDIKKLLNDNS